MTTSITARQALLLGAFDASSGGTGEFSEWDLTVAAWRIDKNRFGCRGYEQLYPDHKRTMSEIMGSTKDNLLRRGLLERKRANYYALTKLGVAAALHLKAGPTAEATRRSPTPIYDAVAGYLSNRVFLQYVDNPEEPRTWLGASAFLGLTSNSALALEDRLRAIRSAAAQALDYLKANGIQKLSHGPVGGGKFVHEGDLQRLVEFVDVLETRFKAQMDAIRDS